MDNQLTAALMGDAFHADRAERSIVYGINTAVQGIVVTTNDMEVPLITSNQVANLKVNDTHSLTHSLIIVFFIFIYRLMFPLKVETIWQQVQHIHVI